MGQVDYSVEPDELRQLFSLAGEVINAVIPGFGKGAPRGCGYAHDLFARRLSLTFEHKRFAIVKFSDAGSVAKAIASLDGYFLKGRNLKANPYLDHAPISITGSIPSSLVFTPWSVGLLPLNPLPVSPT